MIVNCEENPSTPAVFAPKGKLPQGLSNIKTNRIWCSGLVCKKIIENHR